MNHWTLFEYYSLSISPFKLEHHSREWKNHIQSHLVIKINLTKKKSSPGIRTALNLSSKLSVKQCKMAKNVAYLDVVVPSRECLAIFSSTLCRTPTPLSKRKKKKKAVNNPLVISSPYGPPKGEGGIELDSKSPIAYLSSLDSTSISSGLAEPAVKWNSSVRSTNHRACHAY